MTPGESLPPIHLIVLAGGRSTRARHGDATAPKQFRYVGRRMLFMIAVQELLEVPEVVSLTVAVPDPWRAVAEIVLDEQKLRCPVQLASAGPHRTASTWNALQAVAQGLGPEPDHLVAIHDAARPFASHHLLRRVAAAATSGEGGAVPGVAVADTIVQLVDGPDESAAAATYLERSVLQAVQTPQVFRWEPLLAAHRWADEHRQPFTDDGGLMAARGLPPLVVMGEQENWKITTEDDWDRAETLLCR
ncbi:MAG: 2-C-methyl-D-erythritol 4-phosphate cytidylyltransferase [Candidatus Krumholzibacteriia bacterium]